MNLTHFTQKLLDKERELSDQIAALKAEGRSTELIDVGDYGDHAEADQVTSNALDEATRLTHILEEVRDALQRINEGRYGNCTACGKRIEDARLEAVPWTLYCRKDGEAREERMPLAHGSTL